MIDNQKGICPYTVVAVSMLTNIVAPFTPTAIEKVIDYAIRLAQDPSNIDVAMQEHIKSLERQKPPPLK